MTATLMPAPAANGQHRRSLNDSIARLDDMIDGLSTAIPDTIRETLKECVAEAIAQGVKTAVIEVLTNAELLRAFRGTTRLTLRQRLSDAIYRGHRRVTYWVRTTVRRLVGSCASGASVIRQSGQCLRLVWSARVPVAAAVGLGLAVGLIVACTPPWVAGALTGLGATCVSLAVQAGLWARRTVGRWVAV